MPGRTYSQQTNKASSTRRGHRPTVSSPSPYAAPYSLYPYQVPPEVPQVNNNNNLSSTHIKKVKVIAEQDSIVNKIVNIQDTVQGLFRREFEKDMQDNNSKFVDKTTPEYFPANRQTFATSIDRQINALISETQIKKDHDIPPEAHHIMVRLNKIIGYAENHQKVAAPILLSLASE